MTRRSFANEMVRLKRKHPLIIPDSRWKVTARYVVDFGDRQERCVRVRCCDINNQFVCHFSEKRFKQLFEGEAAS